MNLFILKSVIFALLIAFVSVNSYAENTDEIILPDIGESTGTLISPEQEKKLGAAFFRSLQARIEISQDPEIQEYISAIGAHLVANSDSPGIPFHFFVVNDKIINAFAGPGGYIGINAGLFLQTESESELASVIAHEVAHVTQRHIYRSFEAASRLSIPSLAATLAAILVGSQSPELGQAALIALQAGQAQFQINFTRDNEKEADREGIQTLAKSHYDPHGMPTFFERLQQASRFYRQDIPEFLRTHPVTVSRISDTRSRAEKYPYRQIPDSLAYQLIRTKLRVLESRDLKASYHSLQILQNQGTSEQRSVALYGTGLIDTKLGRFNTANKTFKQLVKLYPNQSHFNTALARSVYQSKDYKTALMLYKNARKTFPNKYSIKIEYLSALLQTGNAQTAKNLLLPMLYQSRHTPAINKLLARAYGDLKQDAESHRYLAEYYFSIGQTGSAITQIKLALKAKDLNFYLSSILDQRLRFFILEEQAGQLDI